MLGVDINLEKVAAIGAGRSPVVEPMVEELLSAGVSEGRVESARRDSTAISTGWTW